MSSPFIPQQSPRQVAMLKAMGVEVWWQPVIEDEATLQPNAQPVEQRHETPQPPLAAQAKKVAVLQQAVGVEPKESLVTSDAQAAKACKVSISSPAQPVAPAVVQRVSVGTLDQLDWQALQDTMLGCQQCDLSQRRRQVVPGVGDAQRPDWLFVGEAPGEEEDLQGQPFVGRSGQLLDRMLAAMGLQRERQVFITNVVKCRPPLNRDPQPSEVQQCSPYLLRQIELLQPRMIVALGRFAAHSVLAQGGCLADSKAAPLGRLRGQVHTGQFGGVQIPVVATFHPSYLLRSPAEKHKAWADLCLALHSLETQVPGT